MSQIGLDENLKQLINYIYRNNYPEAEKKISELINIDDYNIPIFYNLVGVVNEKIHKLNLAEENFQKAIELDDKFYPAVFNLGMLKFNNNLFDQAIIFFNKTLEIEPNYYDASHMLAQSFVKLKNFDLAINTYQKTIKIDLNNKAAYINLANLFLALHLDIEAQSVLETAAKQITKDYQILNNLGLIYKRIKQNR